MSRFVSSDTPFFDNVSGAPVALGTAYFGEPNTDPKTNPKVPYSDRALTTPLTASLALTMAGKLPSDVWLSGAYSLTVDDADGNQVFSDAYVLGVDLGGGGGGTGTVESIVAGDGISVDSTDPANPIVSSTVEDGGRVYGETALHTASYTLSADLHNVFRETSGDVTITIPTEASDDLSLPDDEVYMHHIRHTGGGTLVFSYSGITLVLPAGGAASLSEAGQTITVSKSTVAANKWHIYGQTDSA